jgi:hypothetical protein
MTNGVTGISCRNNPRVEEEGEKFDYCIEPEKHDNFLAACEDRRWEEFLMCDNHLPTAVYLERTW